MDAQESLARVRLASSILSWAEPETAIRALVEAQMALDGKTLAEIVEARKEGKHVEQGV